MGTHGIFYLMKRIGISALESRTRYIPSGLEYTTHPGLQVLLYAFHICYNDADGKLEVGAWENT